jgi:hypothetical protein
MAEGTDFACSGRYCCAAAVRWYRCGGASGARSWRRCHCPAGDRPDLLAEVAGILLGAIEGELDEPRSKAAASFCIAAGADQSLILGWIEEGRRRVEIRRKPPFSDPARRPPRRG